jgi:hypothetical protein
MALSSSKWKFRFILIFVLIVIVGVVYFIQKNDTSAQDEILKRVLKNIDKNNPATVEYIKVIYEVIGLKAISITIQNGNGTSQFSDIELPWKYEVNMKKGSFLSISAQNGDNNGFITVRIYQGERSITNCVESRSEGRFVVASVSDTLN